ncbi:hypothetical protein HanPI659440_Chr14g0563881 [Helianthus annuus]|nr:hypothetical protein HanLR1_Chr14g0545551 [Helianthus annuus]KAJ0704546.1 hypothetical protein HanPI659440_Chr14g0563881 [Helianthus annuus]
MTQKTSFLLILTTLLFYTTLGAQDRAPHGLDHENLIALSPSAYSFFHPNEQLGLQLPCEESHCSPLPLAATVQSTLAHESRAGRAKVGAGCIAAIIFGFVFLILLAMGAYYVVTTRRNNLRKNNSTVIPSA